VDADRPPRDGGPGLLVYRFTASLYSANANRFTEEIHAIVKRMPTRRCDG
jgi:hypothetical protein